MLTAAIDALGGQVRRMQQRMPAVRFELSSLWAQSNAARAAADRLEREVLSVYFADGFVVVTFKDLRQVRASTLWEALK